MQTARKLLNRTLGRLLVVSLVRPALQSEYCDPTVRVLDPGVPAARRLMALSTAYVNRPRTSETTAPTLYGLFVGARPVGLGALEIDGTEATIGRFLVRKHYRQRGYGKLILNALETAARSAGAAQIRVTVDIKQADALSLLVWLGYRTCSTRSALEPCNVLLEKGLQDQ